MLKRTISGAILTIIMVVSLIEGHYILWGVLLLSSLMGVRELYQATGSVNKKLNKDRFDILALCGYAGVVAYYLQLFFGLGEKIGQAILLVTLLLMMLIYVSLYPKYEPLDLFGGLFAIVYVAVMLSTVYSLRQVEGGIYFVWLIFVGSWVCDTFAYFVGSAIGKHKMAPVLSPKKSVEGAFGGIIGAAIVSVIYALVVMKIGDESVRSLSIISYVIIAVAASVFSMVGDLVASAIKRHLGIKDYGALIPGHGGILDRFDSVIVTAPLIYYFVLFMK